MLLVFHHIGFQQDVGRLSKGHHEGLCVLTYGGQDPSRALKPAPVAEEVPDACQQPPLLPSSLQAASGSPLALAASFLAVARIARPGSPPLPPQAWISGRSSCLTEPLKARWAGLLHAGTGVSELPGDAASTLARSHGGDKRQDLPSC